MQPLEIVSPGLPSVTVIVSTVTNRTDGVTVVHLVSIEQVAETIYPRLQAMPEISELSIQPFLA